jgi:hypothetical protein
MSTRTGGASEYVLRNGINYRADGYAFCDRCGRRPIVNDKCLNCDVRPTEADRELAHEIKQACFSPRQEREPGFRDFRYESFDEETAARILAAKR